MRHNYIGENLFSAVDSRNLLRHGGMNRERDVLQFDCALSYGRAPLFFKKKSPTPCRPIPC